MNFDDRLRAALAHGPLPTTPPGFVEDVLSALPARRTDRQPRRWLAGATVATIGLAVLVGAGALLAAVAASIEPSGPSTGSPAGSPTASSASSATALATVPALGAWTHLAWRDVSGPAFDGTKVDIRGGLGWAGGDLLYGQTQTAALDRTDGVVWTSADGRMWRRTPGAFSAPGAGRLFSGVPLVGVAASGDTLVAVGQPQTDSGDGPAPGSSIIWISHDGLAWTPVAGPVAAGIIPAGVVAGPGGFVIYGRRAEPPGQAPVGGWTTPSAVILSSPDGVTWSESALPDNRPVEAVWSVAATSDGFAALGGPAGTDGSGAAWWSTDGLSWHAASGIAPGYSLGGILPWPDGSLHASATPPPPACAPTCTGPIVAPTLMVSADGGRTWHSSGITGGFSWDTTLVDDGRLVRLESEPSPWGSWTADGSAWISLRMDGDTFRPPAPEAAPEVQLLIADGPMLMAAANDGSHSISVYLGHLDDQPGPVPTPTTAPGSQDTPCGTDGQPCGP